MPDAKSAKSRSSLAMPQAGESGNDSRRRNLLKGLLAGSLVCGTPLALAQRLTATPAQTEGPFFPDKLPLDQDNDLVLIAGHGARAAGEITDLTGRILDLDGTPLPGVTIEIWQVDHHGHYIHTADASAKNDPNFQGYGRFETGKSGQYRFRTIKPVPYPGRTPHIHVKLQKGGRELLTTQLYVQGHPLNERDGVLRSLRDNQQRASLMVPFLSSQSHPGELAARFDIVMGLTATM
jgi:protocatechuate 3,4-dioxygenase beta subunit